MRRNPCFAAFALAVAMSLSGRVLVGKWDGLGRFGTGMGRFWDGIGVLEWRFWAENEGLGRNGTIWDGFGHVQSVPLGIFFDKLFIFNYLR